MAKFAVNNMKIEVRGVDISDHVEAMDTQSHVGDIVRVVLTLQADDEFIRVNGRGLQSFFGNWDGKNYLEDQGG